MDADIKTPQDALEWLDSSIREEVELDGEMSNEHAIQLGFIQNMLIKFPRRNCDVGTAEEQSERFAPPRNCDMPLVVDGPADNKVIPQSTRLELESECGKYPRVKVSVSAVISSLSLNIDAVELSKFKTEVCRFMEEQLPKHIKVVDRKGGAL